MAPSPKQGPHVGGSSRCRPEPHSSALRRARVSLPQHGYMVTTCAAQRGATWLVEGTHADLLIQAMRWQRDQRRLVLLGYCIMPDHLHWLFCLRGSAELREVMRSFGSYTARRLADAPRVRGRIWQEGFHDRALRGLKEYYARLAYVHDNPVRAGLVESAEAWPYSTAHPSLEGDIEREWLL